MTKGVRRVRHWMIWRYQGGLFMPWAGLMPPFCFPRTQVGMTFLIFHFLEFLFCFFFKSPHLHGHTLHQRQSSNHVSDCRIFKQQNSRRLVQHLIPVNLLSKVPKKRFVALQSLPSDRIMQDIPIIAPVNVAQFPFSYMYFYAAFGPVAGQDIYVLCFFFKIFASIFNRK